MSKQTLQRRSLLPAHRTRKIAGVILFAAICSIYLTLSAVARAESVIITPPESLPTVSTAPPLAGGAEAEKTIIFPTGDLFKPLLADPKEPRFYLSYRVFNYRSQVIHVGAGGYGEFFGLYRSVDTTGGFSWQSSFGGGIHAQFDIDAPSFDLVNADYTIGFPFTFRRGAESYRFAIYHQSSHLGDEFLLHNNVERVELSFEALELIGSYEWTTWRTYYGGDYIIHQGPTDLKPVILHVGAEYYGTGKIVGRGRLVGGLDVKGDESHDWTANSSLKFGLQFDSSEPNGRYMRILAEEYDGFTPYGQFYNYRTTYFGLGVYLGFE